MPDAAAMKKLVSLCLLRDLPEGTPRLVRAEGRRLACVRRGERVDVLEDRCPHEGHPLSMGSVRGGVLTCPWHNWKFDVATGRCMFGGESARHYPVEIVDEEVFVDLVLDEAEARRRVEEDLLRAVAEGAIDGAVREALRLDRLGGDPMPALVRAAAMRAPYGAGDALVAVEAAIALREARVLDDAEAYAVAASAVADEARGRPERPLTDGTPATFADRDAFLEDLLEERRHEAVARARELARGHAVAEIAERWFVPFASLKLWDRGATVARLVAGARLGERYGESVREEVVVSLATSLGWAVAESDLPAWRATRTGLLEAARIEPGDGPLAVGLAAELRGDERAAVAAALEAARQGTSPSALLEELATVALERLLDYDHARSTRIGSAVTAYEPARAVVFADAALRLARPQDRSTLAQAVMLAGLAGRLGRYVSPRLAGRDAASRADELASTAREAVLSPRAPWSSRGRVASLAAACLRLGTTRSRLATLALEHAAADAGGGLARIAATARQVVEGRDVDD